MEKPIIMVSSTCYDLKQVRDELRILIDDFHYESIVSESPDFPVNPEIGTIENCRKKVELYADIMILIIGGRYGSIEKKTGKSVTNLEYIEARNKGIPIYVFVESKILSYIEIWKKNRDADYSGVVDTTELFSFIEHIRNTDSVWIFPFNVINDIKTTFISQIAYLFKLSLIDRLRLRKNAGDRLFQTVSSRALQIVVDKPKAWEYLLFYQVWIDEIELISEKIYEYKYNINLSNTETLDIHNIAEWAHTRLHEISIFVDSANVLIGKRLQIALGEIGEPGDEKELIMVARGLVKVLTSILDWTLRVRGVRTEEPLTRVINAMAKFSDKIISNMQDFPYTSLLQIKKAIEIAGTDNPLELVQTITFELSNMDEFNEAMSKAVEYVSRMNIIE